jgi:hypothetical protein
MLDVPSRSDASLAEGVALPEAALPGVNAAAPQYRPPPTCTVCFTFRDGLAILDPASAATTQYDIARGYGFSLALGLRVYYFTFGAEGAWQYLGQNSKSTGSHADTVNLLLGSLAAGLRSPILSLGDLGLLAGGQAGYSWPKALDHGALGAVDLAGAPFLEGYLSLVQSEFSQTMAPPGPARAVGLGFGYRQYLGHGGLQRMLLVTVGLH